MGLSVLVSLLGGTVLGYFAATQHALADRWSQVVQAHGHLQLVGWAAVFVCALMFEFGPRITQRPLLPVRRRAFALLSLALGAVLEAVGQVWYGPLGLLFPIGALLAAGGGAAVLIILLQIRPQWSWRRNMHPLWLPTAATWLTAALVLQAGSVLNAGESVTPLHESRFVTELLVRGFLLQVILGIALRAFPGHFGLAQISNRKQQWLWGGLNVMVIAWAISSGAFGMPDVEVVRRGADIALGIGLIVASGWLGIVGVVTGARRGPRYQPLVVIAWAALLVYAVLLAVEALLPGWETRSLYEEGAVRHIFLLGFVAPLMVAIAHLVLERFGTGLVKWENALTTAFFLVAAAWPLRVFPALFVAAPGPIGRSIMGIAATFLTLGLALFAAVLIRNAVAFAGLDRKVERRAS